MIFGLAKSTLPTAYPCNASPSLLTSEHRLVSSTLWRVPRMILFENSQLQKSTQGIGVQGTIGKENVSNQAEAPCLATSDSTARRVSTNVGCSKVGPTSNLISSSRTGPHVFLLPLIFLRVPLSPPLQSNPHPAAPRVPRPAAMAFLRSCYIGAARPGRRCCDDNSALLRPAAVGAASLQSGGDAAASPSGGGGAAYAM
jgi:hypothetical protein